MVATQNSFHFFNRKLIPVEIYEDKDEWQVERGRKTAYLKRPEYNEECEMLDKVLNGSIM